MILANAIGAGMDFMTAMEAPFSMVQDLIASHEILHLGFRRELTGDDAEDEFMRLMAVK